MSLTALQASDLRGKLRAQQLLWKSHILHRPTIKKKTFLMADTECFEAMIFVGTIVSLSFYKLHIFHFCLGKYKAIRVL